MQAYYCNKAFTKEKRGKIYCKASGTVCAHAYYCDVVNKYRQHESAKDCPGKDDNA